MAASVRVPARAVSAAPSTSSSLAVARHQSSLPLRVIHASTLGFGRALPAALAMQRFATSSEATQAISTGRAGTASSRARPRPHVTLWRSVAAGLETENER